MVLGFNSGVSMIWSPTADLFTDAAATIPYAGESMAMVYAKPSSTITYTATATSSLTNCPRTGSVIVTVLSPCQIPTGVNVTNVAATSATVSWTEPGTPPGQGYEYEIRTSGAPGSGETGLFATGTTGAGVTTAGLSGLTPGTQYHVYVRSNCGDNVYSLWTSDVSFTTPYLPLAVTGVVTDNTCAYSCDGSIVTTVTGGLAPYTYLWSHGSTDASPTSLCGGIFTVTVTDAAMSTITETWTVVEPAELVLTGTVTNATCPGSVNGAINLSVTGGTSPYQYLWSTGAVTPNISGLAPGTYEVTVTDSHSCTNTGNWTVGMSNPICDNITVSGVDSTTKCYNAINTIVVAGTPNTYTVTAAGDVSFIAGLKISFMPGTKVLLGGYMHARIYSNEWCTATKLTEVASQPEEPMPSTDRAKFTLYPNPTNGNFVLMQKGEHPYGHMRVEIFNMNGEKILTEENVGIKQEFRFEMMPSGLYFVKIIAEDYTETIKLVKVK